VAVNSKGHVFVFSRGNSTGPAYAAAAAQLLEFGPDGTFIREIGKNLYAWSFAHAVRIDKDDNIWCVDKGSDMIIKFNPEGRVVMVFGRKQEASDESTGPLKHPTPPLAAEDGRFRQPTDVTWDPAGDVYISDGYVNSRIAKIDKNGNWIKSWGDRGSKPGEFNTPHSIAADARGTSMWRTVLTGAFRCSTQTVNSCALSRSMCHSTPTHVRRSATSLTRRQPQVRLRPAHPGQFALLRSQIRFCIVPMPIRAASTSLVLWFISSHTYSWVMLRGRRVGQLGTGSY
jgi:hypothetical protein